MDSSILGFLKNGYDWTKEAFSFLFFNEKPIKSVSLVNNLIIFCSKHQSNKKIGFHILKAICVNENKEEKFKNKTTEIKERLKNINSNITLINTNDEVLFFLEILKKENITLECLNTRKLGVIGQRCLSKIHSWQKISRIILVLLSIVSIFFLYYFNNASWLLLINSIFFIILIIKSQSFYRFYSIIRTLPVQDSTFENSIFYQLTKEYDTQWFNEINKINHTDIVLKEKEYIQTQRVVSQELLSLKIKDKERDIIDITDSDIKLLAESNNLGEFKLTNDIENLHAEENDLLIKVFDHILINDKLNLTNILQNIWKIIQKKKCANSIKKWLNLNKKEIPNIIDITQNKMNLVYIFSHLNNGKQNLAKNITEQSTAVINNLNEIEEVFLEHMSLDNFIDFFETLDKNKAKNNLINIKE